jgi:hypothetical protein
MTRQALDLPKGLGAVVFTALARGLAVKVFPDGTVPDVGFDKFPRVVLINVLVVSVTGGLAGHELRVCPETSRGIT